MRFRFLVRLWEQWSAAFERKSSAQESEGGPQDGASRADGAKEILAQVRGGGRAGGGGGTRENGGKANNHACKVIRRHCLRRPPSLVFGLFFPFSLQCSCMP